MGAILITLVALLAFSNASPLPNRLKYDQKQEGKWNVRADLENFIILVIPTSSPGSSSVANTSLLDFLSKTIPLPYHKFPKRRIHHHAAEENLPDTEQFIESKTAPYHVDISRTRSHLAKLHPDVSIPEGVKEDVIIARSPSVALSKSQELHARNHKEHPLRTSRAIVITVPMENENVQMHDIKGVIGKIGEDAKKKLGLSAAAIEIGLAEQYHNNPMKNIKDSIQILEPIKQENTEKNATVEYDKLSQEMKVAYAKLVAKAIQENLIAYFKNIAQKLKEENEKEKEEEPEKEETIHKEKMQKPEHIQKEEEKEKRKSASGSSSFAQKMVKIYEKIKERQEMKKNPVHVPNIELEPPRMELEEMKNKEPIKVESMVKPIKKPNKEGHKDELLLLGAVNEQCGPGQVRDSYGICVFIKS